MQRRARSSERSRKPSPAGPGRAVRRRAERGAIAIEYILITALVAIALISVMRHWGDATSKAVGEVSVDQRGALQPP